MSLIEAINVQVKLENLQSVFLFVEILLEQLMRYVIMEIRQDVQKTVNKIQDIHAREMWVHPLFVLNAEMVGYQE